MKKVIMDQSQEYVRKLENQVMDVTMNLHNAQVKMKNVKNQEDAAKLRCGSEAKVAAGRSTGTSCYMAITLYLSSIPGWTTPEPHSYK
eukprot:1445472-Ditylum_brightwellii.AAC.2